MSKYFNIVQQKISHLILLVQKNPGLFLKRLLVILLAIVVIMAVYSCIELIVDLQHNRNLERNSILLEVLPKETSKIKDTENLIRNVHSILLNTSWRKLLYGRPYISYEIGASEGKIKFYIKVPKDYKDVICERIYATYPEIAIREACEDPIPDYDKVYISFKSVMNFIYKIIRYPFTKEPFNAPKKHLSVYGTEMELAYHHVLMLKNNQDKDLLGSIMAGMKNLEWHEKVIVQILARPLDNGWQIRGRRILEKYEKDGIRPTRGNDFQNFMKSFIDTVTDEFDDELERNGIKTGGRRTQRKTRLERKEISVATDKLLESGFETIIRVVAVGHYRKASRSRVKAVTAAFSELDKENRFKRDIILAKKLFFNRAKNRRMYLVDRKNILTTSELSNFFLRFPGKELLNDFPDVEALTVKEFAPPKGVEAETNIFAKNLYRGKETMVGIKDEDLKRHLIVQGMTGSGKSEWVKSILLEQVKKGRGVLLMEPHGKLVDEFIELIPEDRRKDVIYFDLFDPYPPAFNFCKVFDRKGIAAEDMIEKTATEVIEIFKKAFSEAWSGKNEYYFENGIKTVIELQDGNILDIQRLLTDKEFRKYAVEKIKDPQVKQFWITEFAEDSKGQLSQGTQSTVLSVMYKLGKFLNSKKFLRSIAQDDCIDFKDILDNNKIIVFRLAKDLMSKDRIQFLGGVAIKLMIVAAFQRDKKAWDTPFIWAIDEAQNFISESIETVLDELRKYGISLLLMHQRLAQLDKVPGLRDAIYGNAGTMITFTVGKPDAPFFEEIYGPRVDREDLKKLPSRYGYCKLKVDGQTSETFNIYSLDRPTVDKSIGKQSAFEIKKYNREKRMHYKEIDKMLGERIRDYKKVDEVGEIDEENAFVEELPDEYVKYNDSQKIEKYMNECSDETFDLQEDDNPPIDEDLEIEAADSEYFAEDDKFDITVDLPFLDPNYDEKHNEEFNDMNLEDTTLNKGLENICINKTQDIPPIDEVADQKIDENSSLDELDININITHEEHKEKVLKLTDFIGKEDEITKPESEKKYENEIWQKASEMEKEALNPDKKEINKDDDLGEKLWKMAKEREGK